VAIAFGVGFLATLAAAIAPAWRADRMPVDEQLRRNV
jgi:ABC-type lipoprotein release transport system permease subunit